MEIKLITQMTPNPNARKFVVNHDIKTQGKVTFTDLQSCTHVPLARALLLLTNVTQVHLFENVVTVTQNGLSEWEKLIPLVETVIRRDLPAHDPTFLTSEELRRSKLSPDILRIEDILDYSIRPALQGDGGDLEILEYKEHVLTIRYEGACGTCPSSTAGTLEAIQGILREQFDPEIEICTV